MLVSMHASRRRSRTCSRMRSMSASNPISCFSPNYAWRPEAPAIRQHPMFQDLIRRLFPTPDAFRRYYPEGNTQPMNVARALFRSPHKVMYVLSDYSGAIDAWLTDDTMVPGSYAHWRLLGIARQDEWHLCEHMQFMGYIRGDPELAGRASL